MIVDWNCDRRCAECDYVTPHTKDVNGLQVQWTCNCCGAVTDCTVEQVPPPPPICEATMERVENERMATTLSSETMERIRKNVQDAIMTDGTDDLLAERERTHGDYTLTSAIAQELKRVATSRPTTYSGDLELPEVMNDTHREAYDMICTKLARILSGDPHVEEHWLDIEGYARLARQPAD